jgi:WhiB family redox-sensing transcriptional regulator
VTNTDWMRDASCATHPNPDLWFPNSTGRLARQQAQEAGRICAQCPVQDECAEHRKQTGANTGVWGGSYHRTHAPRKTAPINHGTDSGYHQHMKRRETACNRCRFAHADAERRRVSA